MSKSFFAIPSTQVPQGMLLRLACRHLFHTWQLIKAMCFSKSTFHRSLSTFQPREPWHLQRLDDHPAILQCGLRMTSRHLSCTFVITFGVELKFYDNPQELYGCYTKEDILEGLLVICPVDVPLSHSKEDSHTRMVKEQVRLSIALRGFGEHPFLVLWQWIIAPYFCLQVYHLCGRKIHLLLTDLQSPQFTALAKMLSLTTAYKPWSFHVLCK